MAWAAWLRCYWLLGSRHRVLHSDQLERTLAVPAEVCRLGWGGGSRDGEAPGLSGCLDCVGMQLRGGR